MLLLSWLWRWNCSVIKRIQQTTFNKLRKHWIYVFYSLVSLWYGGIQQLQFACTWQHKIIFCVCNFSCLFWPSTWPKSPLPLTSLCFISKGENWHRKCCDFNNQDNSVEVPVVQWLSSQDMDTATRVQILDLTDCISHTTNTLGKGMNPKYSPSSYG